MLCILSTSSKVFVKSKKEKRKKINYMAWSLLWTVAVLTVLHSFLHINRWGDLFTRQTTTCDSIEELPSACKLYHTLITSLVISMQISDRHSKASTHSVQLSQDGVRVSLCKVKTNEQKSRENIICFLLNYRTGDTGKDLWRSSSQFFLLKHGELQQVA